MDSELCNIFNDLNNVVLVNVRVGLKHKKHNYPKKIIISNQDFFDDINTEEKAYWLGFLYADGCIFENKHEKEQRNSVQHILSLGLSKKDEVHLQKFADIFGVKLHYKKNGNGDMSYIQICSKYLYDRLFELGMRNRNLNIIKEKVSEDLIRHFIRGFFDGDGCITKFQMKSKYHKKTTKEDVEYIYDYCGVSFACFSYEFANDLQNIICNKTGLSKTKIIKHTGNCWYPYWGGKYNINLLYDWLYKDMVVCLERKYGIFNDILLSDNLIKNRIDSYIESLI